MREPVGRDDLPEGPEPAARSGPVQVDAEHFADEAAEFTVYRLACEVCGRDFSSDDYMRLAVELNRHLFLCRRSIIA